MAKTNFSLNFDGFLDLAADIDNLGNGYLKQAVDNALTASKDYLNNAAAEAMAKSRYNFERGQGYSRGKAKASLEFVKNMPIDWDGSVASAYVGVRLRDALEVQFLIYGTPHIAADTNLRNVLKAKGKYKKEVSKIQLEEFNKVIEEALKNG